MFMDERHHIGGSDFGWDADKADANWQKHRIRFEEAAAVFADPLFVVTDASRNDEARDALIGFDRIGRLLYVVHVEFEGDCIRIVSARPAEPREEALYAQ
jgi:uncharacterized DUF497 family protein